MYRIALERLVIELGLLDRVDVRGPAPHHAVPGLYAEVDALVNDMRAGRDRQGRLRGGRDLPAGDRLEPGVRQRSCPTSSASPTTTSTASPRRSGGSRRSTGTPSGRGLREIGRARALGRRVGRPRRRARPMSGRVLHVGKVAGISGAENHLLLLLPALRERGWDVAAVMLHEGEPGAEDFAARLEADGVPVERVRLSRAIDPRGVLAASCGGRGASGPAILHTHLVHADFHGLPAGRLARVPVLVSTKHGFNAFRDGKAFAAADRAVASLADVHIAISAGPRALPRRERGLRPGELRGRPLRHRGGARAAAAPGRAAARDRRPADPDQGPRRAAPRASPPRASGFPG